MNDLPHATSAAPRRPRTSELLRAILTKNPDLEVFTVEQIIASIGDDRVEASMMVFVLPAIIPVPRPRGVVALPVGAAGCQLMAGSKRMRLPGSLLRKQVSRRSLAVAIHALIPILEATEKVVRPRWTWASQSISRRAIGLLLFLLAVSLACPLIGFEALHAISIFVVSLGLAEADGLAITVGVAAGILALAVAASSCLSLRAVRAKLVKLLRTVGKKLGLEALAGQLAARGYPRLASLLRFDWTDVLMRWDPEGRYARGPVRGTQEMSRPASSNQDMSRSERPQAPLDPVLGARLQRVA